jgi:8-oxo-dGTP pyrophosphatase MutT (NUDIX family)
VSRFHFSLPARAFLMYARFRRGMTFGARAAVFDDEDRVFLVRHTYTPGWYLPGGGVEPGETVEAAVRRELLEEAGIVPRRPPELFGIYLNAHQSRRDHVAVFVCRDWSRVRELKLPNMEIADAGFFAPAGVPADTTAGTRRRLAEIVDGGERAAVW